MRRFYVVILLTFCFMAPAYAASDVTQDVKRGNILYNKGEFEEALKSYEEAFIDAPDSDIVNFDLGAALYKTEDYEGAIEHFEKVLVSDDSSIEQKASYNLGNAEYKFGIGKEDDNLSEAVSRLEESLRHYERALELDREDGDAEYNYEFVKEELQRLQQKLAQQQTGESEGEEKEGEQEKGEEQQQPSQESQQEEEARQQEGQEAQGQEGEQEQEERASTVTEPEAEEGEGQPYSESAAQEPSEEMSEREVEMLLESYRQEEEPKDMYRQRIPVRGLPEVLKDW